MAMPALAPGLRVALGGSSWAAAVGSSAGPGVGNSLAAGMVEVVGLGRGTMEME